MGKGNGNHNGITAAQAIEAAKNSKGFVTVIAKTLGVSASYVYRLQDKYPTFKQAILEERENNKDIAETKLFDLINEKNPTAIIFYLKTQGKDRGYVERQEVKHSGEINQSLVILPSKDDE